MSMEYIRRTYNVPAKRGMRVVLHDLPFRQRKGVIVGSKGAYLRVRFDQERKTFLLHPIWKIEYMESAAVAQLPEAER